MAPQPRKRSLTTALSDASEPLSVGQRTSNRRKGVASKTPGKKPKIEDEPVDIEDEEINSEEADIVLPSGLAEHRDRLENERISMMACRKATKVLQYPLFKCCYFDDQWLGRPELGFLASILKAQKWDKLVCFSGPICLIEVAQFYATVTEEDDYLTALVNGTDIVLTDDDLSSSLEVPNVGTLIDLNAHHNLTPAAKLALKRFVYPSAGSGTEIQPRLLQPSDRLLLHLIYSTLAPRPKAKQKIQLHDLQVLQCLKENNQVNLVRLFKDVVLSVAAKIRDGVGDKTLKLCYGMLLSKVLKAAGVVKHEDIAFPPPAAVDEGLLSEVGLEVVVPTPVEQGESSGGATTMGAAVGARLSSLEAKVVLNTASIAQLLGIVRGLEGKVAEQTAAMTELTTALLGFTKDEEGLTPVVNEIRQQLVTVAETQQTILALLRSNSAPPPQPADPSILYLTYH